MLCSVTIRFVGQSRSYYRRRAIEYEYEYLPTDRTEYEYERILYRDSQTMRLTAHEDLYIRRTT
jgi:hypothetical protein